MASEKPGKITFKDKIAPSAACGRRDISPFRFNQRAMQRRSLIESLSEEERAFVEAGKPHSTRKTVPPVQQPVATEDLPVQKNPAPAKKLPPTAALPPVLVSQTYRLPADLVKQLIKVAVSR